MRFILLFLFFLAQNIGLGRLQNLQEVAWLVPGPGLFTCILASLPLFLKRQWDSLPFYPLFPAAEDRNSGHYGGKGLLITNWETEINKQGCLSLRMVLESTGASCFHLEPPSSSPRPPQRPSLSGQGEGSALKGPSGRNNPHPFLKGREKFATQRSSDLDTQFGL